MQKNPLIQFTDKGMYVPRADVYIDPWKPVARALITHAHGDHARWGMKHYLAHEQSIPILKRRLGPQQFEGIAYGKSIQINGVEFTFFPAGHVLGSAQIRVAYQGDVWVASGDYKTIDDGISPAFEPVQCNTFITESTFGLPVYNWKPQPDIMAQINAWWSANAAAGKCSIMFAYSLGKAQRILQHVDHQIGEVLVHGSVQNMNEAYEEAGVHLKPTKKVDQSFDKNIFKTALIFAPLSAEGSLWMKKFEPYTTAVASGWMGLRGAKRRDSADTGFVLSDHADWPGLNSAVKATGASQILVTHGYTAIYAKYLSEQGYDAQEVLTKFVGEQQDAEKQEEEKEGSP